LTNYTFYSADLERIYKKRSPCNLVVGIWTSVCYYFCSCSVAHSADEIPHNGSIKSMHNYIKNS
jgi:hypothetical protein